MRRYAIKLHLTHPVPAIGPYYGRSVCPPGPQVRRVAGTQAGTSSELEVPRLARPINSICPKRLRILPEHSALSLVPVPVHQGVLLSHQTITARQFKHNRKLLSTLGGAHPGHALNLSRVHQPPSERCVASPGDAMWCDTMGCPVAKGNSSCDSILELRSVGVVPCPPLLLCVSSCVFHRVSTVFVLSDCATTAVSSFVSAMPVPCHVAGCEGSGSAVPSSFLDEANCPSGIVYRADGSRLAARPSHARTSTSQAIPLRIPSATSRVRCPLRGVHGRCSSRLLSSPLHYAKRNENRPILRPVVSSLRPAKVCLSCPPSLTYTLTFLRFLPPAPPFWHIPLAKLSGSGATPPTVSTFPLIPCL